LPNDIEVVDEVLEAQAVAVVVAEMTAQSILVTV